MYGDPDSRIPKFLLMECGILGFGIRNTTQEVRNPTNDWNPESKFYWQILESSTWNPRLSWIPLHRVNDNSEAKKNFTVLTSRWKPNVIIFLLYKFQ